MVRLRHNDGSADEIPDSQAIEILGDDGNLGLVVLQDKGGTIRILAPGDALFRGYCATQGMRPSNVHVHKPAPVKSAL